MLNFNGTAQNVTKSNPFRQRSHGGENCSDDGGAHEGEPALHPTPLLAHQRNNIQIRWRAESGVLYYAYWEDSLQSYGSWKNLAFSPYNGLLKEH